MKRLFRKYHRTIALIISLPILLTILSGMGTTFVCEWGLNLGLSSNWLLKIHTGEIFHLEGIYPILNGIGLLGLLVTGMSMSGLFNRRPQKPVKN
jgi:hypothetical protein